VSASLAVRWHDALAAAGQRLGSGGGGGGRGREGSVGPFELSADFGFAGWLCREAGVGDRDAEWHADRMRRALEQTLLREHARAISRTLTAAHCPHLFCKGVALLGKHYRPGERSMADIDVLIAPAAREAALQALGRIDFLAYPDREQAGPPTMRAGLALVAPAPPPLEAANLDLHWGLEPVEWLLPRSRPVPEALWAEAVWDGDLPVPSLVPHVALLLHHLVHHDFLHVRGLLDLSLLWRELATSDGPALERWAAELGVRRPLRVVADVLAVDLGLQRLAGVALPRDARSRALRSRLGLVSWLVTAASAPMKDHAMITPARIARRALAVDRAAGLWRLARDVVAPPSAHLTWRWPDAGGPLRAWWQHARQMARKARPGTRLLDPG